MKLVTVRYYNVGDAVYLLYPKAIDHNQVCETIKAIVLRIFWHEGQFLYLLGVDVNAIPQIWNSCVTVSFENILGHIDKPTN